MGSLQHAADGAGEKGKGKSGKPLHFKGSTFHRVIPDFMCQARLTPVWSDLRRSGFHRSKRRVRAWASCDALRDMMAAEGTDTQAM